MKGEVQVGDVVRVSYEGTVETVMSNSGGVRVNGAWHHVHSRAVTSVEIIEPALRVGWHRTVAAVGVGAVVARHWSGRQWGTSEQTHNTVREAFRSIEFLGGGDDE